MFFRHYAMEIHYEYNYLQLFGQGKENEYDDDVTMLRGPPGPSGKDGRDGKDGLKGERGEPGESGSLGPRGLE